MSATVWPEGRVTVRPETRAQLQDMVDRLVSEYGEFLGPGTIARCVARSAESADGIGVDEPQVVAYVDEVSRWRIETRLRDGFWPPLSSCAPNLADDTEGG